MIDPHITVQEAAELLNWSVWTVRRWIKTGKFQRVAKFPGGYRIPEAEVQRVLKNWQYNPTE